VAAVLGKVMASALGPRVTLRGSLVTQRWVPSRSAHDVDFCLDGAWTVEALEGAVSAVLEGPFTVLFPESRLPGGRVVVGEGPDQLQVDFGQDDPLAISTERAVVHGVELPIVRPEQMLAWKIHGLVEFGPRGRWSPKTLADVVLIHRHVPALDHAALQTSLEVAFSSRGLTFHALDEFLDDPTWGRSRGSRNKWRSYRRKAPWLTLELEPTLEEARALVRRLTRAEM
jgi:hypothetical protein